MSVRFGTLQGVADLNELQASIERQIDDLSADAERLRAALLALGSIGTAAASARGARLPQGLQRQAAPHSTSRSVHEPPGQPAPTVGEIVTAIARRQGVTDTAVGGLVEGATHKGAERVTVAERAIAQLRSELSAGLRNGRR